MKLSDTQMQILAAAAAHPLRLVVPPAKLPVAAREAVRKSLLAKGLIEAAEVDAADAHEAWATDAGPATYRSVAQEPAEGATAAVEAGEAAGGRNGAADATPPHTAPTESLEASLPQRRPGGLRYATTAVLAAWAARSEDPNALKVAIASLHAALAGKAARPAREPGASRPPRQGTKQEQVLALLRRPEGATVAQVMEATGWQQHTVRGFFAGLKKRQGIAVEVMERVRQVGPNNTGAKGSYSIYRIAEAG
ncbi:DUF3489 domain-containing protein [Falsiroseomonas sp.]|uniref:DUF3489 domain-containing protein n=1 Tax=Falsiroseomonas sp. TaxID=2870721 RepID=UPI003F70FB72